MSEPLGEPSAVPPEWGWTKLAGQDGDEGLQRLRQDQRAILQRAAV